MTKSTPSLETLFTREALQEDKRTDLEPILGVMIFHNTTVTSPTANWTVKAESRSAKPNT